MSDVKRLAPADLRRAIGELVASQKYARGQAADCRRAGLSTVDTWNDLINSLARALDWMRAELAELDAQADDTPIRPAYLHGGSPDDLQREIAAVFAQVVQQLQAGQLPRTGAAVIGLVNAAAYLCAHSPLPADARAWARMCKSAFEKYQATVPRPPGS